VSLADLLVALALVGVVLSGVFGILDQGQRLYAMAAARVESQQTARIAMDRLAREIRHAGEGRPGADFAAITVAEPTRIVLHFDVDGDGVIAGTGETVTWLLRGRVLRRDAGAGAQPIINGVRDFALRYFDASGAPTPIPSDVRTVAITLSTEPDHVAGDPSRRAATTVSTAVRLRNR
jgi:type II secretory pathway component PulJ